MTAEEMTAALYLFCPFSVQPHLKFVLLSFRHLWLGAYGSYMVALPICFSPSHIRVRMKER